MHPPQPSPHGGPSPPPWGSSTYGAATRVATRPSDSSSWSTAPLSSHRHHVMPRRCTFSAMH
ncbi:hypothetical protein GW17_00006842, partial [Ensete ventricosum]